MPSPRYPTHPMAQRWYLRRVELLGVWGRDRDHVAAALGVGRRTLDRWETKGPPDRLYEYALMGLSVLTRLAADEAKRGLQQ